MNVITMGQSTTILLCIRPFDTVGKIMSEKLFVRWNEFQENLNNAFHNLRSNKDFTDVTLACEDGRTVEAHRIVLSSFSPVFESLLKRIKPSHPLIYMRGVKSEDLITILDFLYCGKAEVLEENLDSFLAIAEELQLSGLMGQRTNVAQEGESSTDQQPQILEQHQGTNYHIVSESSAKEQMSTIQDPTIDSNKKVSNVADIEEEQTAANLNPDKEGAEETLFSEQLTFFNLPSLSLHEIEARVESMMEKGDHIGSQYVYICKVCGKKADKSNVMLHIEVHHLEGIALPCRFCGHVLTNRMSLRRHERTKHKNLIQKPIKISSMSYEEIEEKVHSLMDRSKNKHGQNGYLCKVCGKFGEMKAVKYHIETHHIEGITLPCSLCEKVYRSRQDVRRHKKMKHGILN